MIDKAGPTPQPDFIEVGPQGSARRIAVRLRGGATPGLFWLGGFNSDMKGTKALALDAWAAEQGRACVRFDYSGMANPVAGSSTAPSAVGSRRALPYSSGLAVARRW